MARSAKKSVPVTNVMPLHRNLDSPFDKYISFHSFPKDGANKVTQITPPLMTALCYGKRKISTAKRGGT